MFGEFLTITVHKSKFISKNTRKKLNTIDRIQKIAKTQNSTSGVGSN